MSLNFDNVTLIILGLIVVAVVSLVYGNQEILLMVVSGLLGFLAKDKSDALGSTVDKPPVVEKDDTIVGDDEV